MRNSIDYQALVNLLRSYDTEESWFEFKVDNTNPERIGEYVSALSNSAAVSDHSFGYLIWGIDDSSHEIVGTHFRPRTAKKGNQDLLNWLMTSISPRISLDFTEITMNERNVVILEIPAAISEPVRFADTEYIRVGSNMQRLSKYPEIERALWKRFDELPAEMHIVRSGVPVSDLSSLLALDEYFLIQNLPVPSSLESIAARFVEERFLVAEDDGRYSITALGALLFARNLLQFPMLASKALRIILYKGNGRLTAVNDVTVVEGYAISFESSFNRVNDMLKQAEIIGSALREDVRLLPPASVREVMGNILIHQDLSIRGAGPLVEIFENRLEGSNPGSLLVPRDRIIDSAPRARNEALAAFLRRLHICEERGSGFDRIEEGMALMNLPSPLVETGADFTRIKLLSPCDFSMWSLEDRLRTCYMFTCLLYIEGVPVTNSELRARFGISESNSAVISRIIRKAVEDGLIRIHDESVGVRARRYDPYWA